MTELTCMFCGRLNTFRDVAFTSVRPNNDKPAFGWHPGCWPLIAENLGDLILRRTPEGVRARVKVPA